MDRKDNASSLRDDVVDDPQFSAPGVNVSGGLSSSFTDVGDRLSASGVNSLRRSVNRHNDNVAKVLLGSKDSIEKRKSLESAFRACKEAFFEVSAAYLSLLDERQTGQNSLKLDDIRTVSDNALENFSLGGQLRSVREVGNGEDTSSGRSYASVAKLPATKVRLSSGPVISVPKTTSFLIVPENANDERYPSSRATMEAVQKTFKPSRIALRVDKVSMAGGNGVRIDAINPDLDRIRSVPELGSAGLKVQSDVRLTPKIVIYGVPAHLSGEEICSEIKALNLRRLTESYVKVVRIFPSRDRRYTSCVVEVSPVVRTALKKEPCIYIGFSACRYADHVRVLLCYKCLSFGHISTKCKIPAKCGHCSEGHETRDCHNKNSGPICVNCKRWSPNEDLKHAATNGRKCSVIKRRILEKIKHTNYD
ncbi:hypothetical protein X777_06914 [Ooceraea biroi]|uniref:CCHC-type domain-containing protein n=1 Tax=Ooceraea biroi TaxID=2015173 RepID=A0A026WF28_OOCBI|nr:hypothetical protein X777_06914 [Ooceraea biroi]